MSRKPKRLKSSAAKPVLERRAGTRGFAGKGNGRVSVLTPFTAYRGTTVQVCGLNPFSVGQSAPQVGVPLGRHLFGGGMVCADPITWFQQHLITNPSMMILSLPGKGKSSLTARIMTVLEAWGVIPMVFGDLKPDYVDSINAMGGQVISAGRGHGSINPLDASEVHAAANRLTGTARKALMEDSAARRITVVEALITVARSKSPSERESNIISGAIQLFDDMGESAPLLGDMLAMVRQAPPLLREISLDRGDIGRYQQVTEDLEASLMGLCGQGRFGDVFAKPTTKPMRADLPGVFDVSSIPDTDHQMQAAALLTCWTHGFSMIEAATALAEAGLEPQRHYLLIVDEMHRALRAGPGMVDRFDSLTRLNREMGVGTIYITHTMKDLDSLKTAEDRAKAKGFVERAGMLGLGGLPWGEMPLLKQVVMLSEKEQELMASWSDPPPYGTTNIPPGVGNFLIKVGQKPGIPVFVDLTQAEREVHDTNKAWHVQSQIGRRTHA